MVPNPTRILVPTDFSATADTALSYAKGLAERLGASLHLVHVLTDVYASATYVPEVYAPIPAEARERALAEAQERLRERLNAEEEQCFHGSRAVVSGLTAKEIVNYASQQHINLIVMGTHGRRGVAHLILGSVAEHVVRISHCPVLTVPQAQIEAVNPLAEAAAGAAA